MTPPMSVDGDNATAPGPMLTLLAAAASCSAADVVGILTKMRIPLTRCDVEITGTRRDEEPRRYIAISYRFILSGQGLDAGKAERAVTLSLEKYCSVMATLAPDIDVSHAIDIV